MSNFSFAQNYKSGMGYVNGTAEILGVANDTAFKAVSPECEVLFKSMNNQLLISIPIGTFLDGHPKIDSIFNSLAETNIKITAQLEGGIFELYNEENSDHNFTTYGTVEIGEQEQNVSISYRIYRSLFQRSSNTSNTGSMLLDMNLFINSSDLNSNGYISSPIEIIIVGAYINSIN